MTPDESAPPTESWYEHLKDLEDEDLAELAGDYRWLNEENEVQDEGEEFRKRRDAIIRECERRGMQAVAEKCRPGPGPV